MYKDKYSIHSANAQLGDEQTFHKPRAQKLILFIIDWGKLQQSRLKTVVGRSMNKWNTKMNS